MIEKKLKSIYERCLRIIDKTKDIDLIKFKIDVDLQEIVCFNLQNIGEIAKSLSEETVNENKEIPWKLVKGMRDRIAHGYDTIVFETIFNTAKTDIVTLKENLEKILN